MQGELETREIDNLLSDNYIGRIGCHANGKTYVVPISYAYYDQTIYAHTYDGMKVQMMRDNPNVCFQIDKMHGIADWESVITWGVYEEIVDKDKRMEALKILSESCGLTISRLSMSFSFLHENESNINKQKNNGLMFMSSTVFLFLVLILTHEDKLKESFFHH